MHCLQAICSLPCEKVILAQCASNPILCMFKKKKKRKKKACETQPGYAAHFFRKAVIFKALCLSSFLSWLLSYFQGNSDSITKSCAFSWCIWVDRMGCATRTAHMHFKNPLISKQHLGHMMPTGVIHPPGLYANQRLCGSNTPGIL